MKPIKSEAELSSLAYFCAPDRAPESASKHFPKDGGGISFFNVSNSPMNSKTVKDQFVRSQESHGSAYTFPGSIGTNRSLQGAK